MKRFISLILTILLVAVPFSSRIIATEGMDTNISERRNRQDRFVSENLEVEFDFNSIGIDRIASKTFIGKDGNVIKITVTDITKDYRTEDSTPKPLRRPTKEYLVDCDAGFIDCSFKMFVEWTEVLRVYDYRILTVGGTYSNPNLSHGSNWGKLTFDVSLYAGVGGFSWYLKGATKPGQFGSIITTFGHVQ